MKSRNFDPLHLDIAAFAAADGALDGQWPLAGMTRLLEGLPSESAPQSSEAVVWQVRGERRARVGGEPESRLHLHARCLLRPACQRCLAPVETPVEADRWLRFVADEAQAEELDEDSEEDVLALTRSLDLRTLIEDELLLAQPLVPRHGVCPQPLRPVGEGAPRDAEAAPQRPFAGLAAWKKADPGA